MSRNRTIRRVSITAAIVAATALTTSGVTTRPSSNNVSDDLRRAIDGGRAKNVILFLGDGMGDSEITIARNYQVGANGRLWMDTLPFTGEYTTYALQESNPVAHRLRHRLGRLRDRLGHRIQDQQRPHLESSPAPETR